MALNGVVEERDDLERSHLHPKFVTPYTHGELTHAEREVLGQALSAAGTVMTHRQMSHLARSEDTAITNALASLIYSVAMGSAAALITAGILFIAYNLIGGEEGLYVIFWLVTWGACVLLALIKNRGQGLWHSATGLAHHEIESRERIAKYALDRHLELLEKKWRLR